MKGEVDMADLRLCDSEYSEVCGGFPGKSEDIRERGEGDKGND